MKRYLLDVNILLGIVWEDQQAHPTVLRWFKETGQRSFATCGITQSGFVRVSSGTRFSSTPVPVKEAYKLLAIFTEMPGHAFWPIDLGLQEATAPFINKLFGPLQLTGAYLLGLAIANDGVLATRDRTIAQLAGKAFAKHLLLLD